MISFAGYNFNSMKYFLRIIFLGSVLIVFSCKSTKVVENLNNSEKIEEPSKKIVPVCVGFYNLENLFDTIDQENRDEEFLPGGAKKWNTEKYKIKLSNMAKVISEIGAEYSPDGVAVLGVAEVENDIALNDLVNTPPLKQRGYKFIIYPSPDERGVDVGLIYNPRYFQPEFSYSYTLKIDDDTAFKTRDQLLVKGKLLGEETYFMVAHWPSRRGGQERSEPKRMAAAALGRKIIDSILTVDPGAKIIYMGDLNDDPVDNSLKKVMKGDCPVENLDPDEMYNPMECFYKKGMGTLKYRDKWNLFDQMLLTRAWIKERKGLYLYKVHIFNKPYLFNESGSFKGYPYRTFSGNNFIGGYSDHLPVYVILSKELE